MTASKIMTDVSKRGWVPTYVYRICGGVCEDMDVSRGTGSFRGPSDRRRIAGKAGVNVGSERERREVELMYSRVFDNVPQWTIASFPRKEIKY